MDRIIALVTEGIVHPSLLTQRACESAFVSVAGQIGATFVRMQGPRALTAACARAPAVIVALWHRSAPDPRRVGVLDDWVRSGGRLLALHSALASFKGDPVYRELTGSSFLGHGRTGRFPIRLSEENEGGESLPADGAEAWRPGPLPESFTLVDEPYDVEVHGAQIWYRRSEVPVVWTRSYGAGRVGAFTPGHRAAVFGKASVRAVLTALVRWLLA